MMAQYLVDLTVSVSLVLMVGWFFQVSADDAYLRQALVTQNDVYIAISRFTPVNLLTSYVTTIDHIARSLLLGVTPADGPMDAAVQSITATGKIVMGICLAGPYMMLDIYHQTSGLAAKIVLAGFAVSVGCVFAFLLTARLSFWRLLLASALSPIAASLVFLMLQAFMALMLEAFVSFVPLAPYAVACPVLCTLYWVVFPHADRGATLTVANAIGRVFETTRG